MEDLGGQHDLVRPGELSQGLAGDLFAAAEGIDVGGVEEIDAGLDGLAEEGHGRLLVQDPRPPLGIAVAHAAQAEPRDRHACTAEKRVLHRRALLFDYARSPNRPRSRADISPKRKRRDATQRSAVAPPLLARRA